MIIKNQRISWLILSFFVLNFFNNSNAFAQNDERMTVKKAIQVQNQGILALITNADLGDPIAIYNLAHNYHHGTDTAVDLIKAKNWYVKAASTQSPSVRYKIGRMFELGIIFDKNIQKALEHYTFSAEANDVNAQTNLGSIYLSNKDTLEQGVLWTEKAAQKNSVQAQVNLAIVYQKGLLGTVNIDKAVHWFKEAAAKNNSFSQYQLGLYYYSIKDYKEAFYWFDLATELKNGNAMLYLSMMFDKGLGIEKNREKSILLLKSAAEQGNKKAIGLLKQLDIPVS
jgi:TPR repeat protein